MVIASKDRIRRKEWRNGDMMRMLELEENAENILGKFLTVGGVHDGRLRSFTRIRGYRRQDASISSRKAVKTVKATSIFSSR